MGRFLILILCVCSLLAGCRFLPRYEAPQRLSEDVYLDKAHGAWQAILVANHTGLEYEGLYLDQSSPDEHIELALLEEWSTDDDTAIEWVDLHILETYGLNPSYAQIRDEWVDHINNDIWNSTLKARQLMDEGVLPPDTGSAELNPEGVWGIGAQLETELFGLISPGMPEAAARRARYFARVTNSGLAVEASAFYAVLYALAYFETDVPTLIAEAQAYFPEGSEVERIVAQVRAWHRSSPTAWRPTRELIHQHYDTDPQWWASRVNFASTVMALLYGDGDLMETMTIACLAGWDADNNAAASAGLLGIILGFEGLPAPVRDSTDVYFNQDVTGDMPQYTTVTEIARRTQGVAEMVILDAGGSVGEGVYLIPGEGD